MTVLLDVNVLIALSWPAHSHREPAERWFAESDEAFATCPITQGGLVRFLLRMGVRRVEALTGLGQLMSDRRHEFWVDDLALPDADLGAVTGHRQVTDAYLAALARARRARLATFDRGLAALHPDVAELINS